MYLTPQRARAFFVAAASAALLAACSGAGQSLTPSTGLSPAGVSGDRSTQAVPGHTPTPVPTATPTPAPTSTPSGNVHYKIVTALEMDRTGAFTEDGTECRKHAEAFESETNLSLPVATTTLAVCTADSDHHRGDDARSLAAPNITPTPLPTPTPTPTATPTPAGVPTDLVIIKVKRGDRRDDDEDGGARRVRNATVLTGAATVSNGFWTFPSLGDPNVIVKEKEYRFYVAEPVSGNAHGDDGGGDGHHD